MPACAFGAVPKPGFADIQRWIGKLDLPLDVITLFERAAKLSWLSVALELVDVNDLCASNPETPEAFTPEDFVALAAAAPTFAAPAGQATIQKLARWIRYQAFLNFCDCSEPVLPPGFDCTAAPASLPIGPLDSVAGPFSVSLHPSTLSSWTVHPNGDWDMYFQGQAVVDGGAHDGNELLIEYQSSTGSWVTAGDVQTLNAGHAQCRPEFFQASTPKPATSTAWRIRNRQGGAHTITDFSICFCPFVAPPAALPPQPALPSIPDQPLTACGDTSLCDLIEELGRRLTRIAAQLSDVQAIVGTRDVLDVIGTLAISGEGEVSLVPGTRSVSIELTELGDEAYTSALGRPRGLMRVGSIRYGDGVGYSFRRFIDADRFDDPVPPGSLSLSWQLLPGTLGILRFLG